MKGNPFESLNSDHVEQMLDYLTFESTHRKQICEEISESISDLIQTRVDNQKNYEGRELIDALEDLPDLLENKLDSSLEHQRDITMVLIQQVFSQAKTNDIEIHLDVSKLEDETAVHQSHDFCQKLLKNPETIINQAPPGPNGFHSQSGNEKHVKLQTEEDILKDENLRLKEEIQEKLSHFSQYIQTMKFIKEKEKELYNIQNHL